MGLTPAQKNQQQLAKINESKQTQSKPSSGTLKKTTVNKKVGSAPTPVNQTRPTTTNKTGRRSQGGIFIPQSQKNLNNAGLSSDTGGIVDINKVSGSNPTGGATAPMSISKAFALRKDKTQSFAEFKASAEGQAITGTSAHADSVAANEQLTQDNLAQAQIDHEKHFGSSAGEGEIYDPYAALQAQNMSGGTGNVSGYINAGQATAIRNKYIEGAGSAPELSVPEGGFENNEQRLQAEADHQRALKEWWKKVGEASMEDVSDVVTLTQEAMAETKGYQDQIDALVANLNQANPEMGSAFSSAIDGVNKENLTPDVLSQLQVLAESGVTPQEFTSKAQGLINDQAISSNMNTLGITSTSSTYDMGNGVEFQKGADGNPLLTIDDLPANASAVDLLKMEAAMSTQIGEKALKGELEQWKNYSDSMIRHLETAKEEIAFVMGDARNKLDESKLNAMNEAKYSERKLEIAKDRSLSNIMEQEAAMEGYLKAQLESWGADTSGAALTIMQKNKLNFTKQYTESAQDYDLELSRVSDKITEAEMAYTNRSIELAHKEITAISQINDGFMDGLDKVQSGVSSAFRNKDMKDLAIVKDYIGGVRSVQAAEAKAERDAYEDTRDFNFKLMKEYADNSGYQYKMQPDGSLMMVTNADGSKARTLAWQKANRPRSTSSRTSNSSYNISSKKVNAIDKYLKEFESGDSPIDAALKDLDSINGSPKSNWDKIATDILSDNQGSTTGRSLTKDDIFEYIRIRGGIPTGNGANISGGGLAASLITTSMVGNDQGMSLSAKLDQAMAQHPNSAEDDFVMENGQYVYRPDTKVSS